MNDNTEVKFTHSGGFIAYELAAAKREDIEAAIERIYKNYHPVGYGTSFEEPKQRDDGSWVAHGYRATSCD